MSVQPDKRGTMPTLEDDLEQDLLAALEAGSSDEEVKHFPITLNYIIYILMKHNESLCNICELTKVDVLFNSAGCLYGFQNCWR
jgi:hypothetical protein